MKHGLLRTSEETMLQISERKIYIWTSDGELGVKNKDKWCTEAIQQEIWNIKWDQNGNSPIKDVEEWMQKNIFHGRLDREKAKESKENVVEQYNSEPLKALCPCVKTSGRGQQRKGGCAV